MKMCEFIIFLASLICHFGGYHEINSFFWTSVIKGNTHLSCIPCYTSELTNSWWGSIPLYTKIPINKGRRNNRTKLYFENLKVIMNLSNNHWWLLKSFSKELNCHFIMDETTIAESTKQLTSQESYSDALYDPLFMPVEIHNTSYKLFLPKIIKASGFNYEFTASTGNTGTFQITLWAYS